MSRTPLALFLALLLSNVIIFSNLDVFWLRFGAALALTFVLPGWAWLLALNWLHTADWIERLVLVGGVSSVLSALALLVALLLPGPFTETPNLIALNVVTLSGLVWTVVKEFTVDRREASLSTRPELSQTTPQSGQPTTSVLLILLAIVAVATITRLTRLEYAEFHEDELENMRLIVRAYKGEEYAPFLDSKGPIHWLLPAALWYLNGWVNEGIARTPFVITALLLVPLMFSLGRRLSGGRDSVGLIAAGFVSLNGFFVALARHVENRALIVFWGALALWFAYRYYQENRFGLLCFTALTLAVGLIAHPTVLLYLPVFGYLLWQKLRADPHARRWSGLAVAAGLFIVLTALFYIPYLADPEIGLVYQYFASERVGEALLYNLLWNVFVEDALYSTHYHAPVLVLLLGWLLARHFGQWGWPGWVLLAGLSAAVFSTVAAPNAWIVAQVNLAFVPFILLIAAFMRLPRTAVEIKAVFLWFSLSLGALVFLAKDASNHIQIAYTGWALLAALALVDLWNFLGVQSYSPGWLNVGFARFLKGGIILALAVIVPLILFYQYLSFAALVTTYWQAKIASVENPNSVYNWLYGDIPRPRRAISNPRLAGWKAVGYHWANGTLSGDFRSINESFAVPIWYTLQTPRSCYDDPQNYWVRRDWKGWPEEEQALPGQGYSLTGIVLVDQAPTLHLYQKNAPAGPPETWDVELYRYHFDRLVTPARMAQAENISQPASLNFGDKLLLRGYDLPQTVARPGDLLPVTVYWESLASMATRYRGFVHLMGPDDSRWGQHDDDPACRLLTTEMRPGQQASRQFRLPVDPAAPPGVYRVVFGLYDPNTAQRLPIWDNLAGQSPGDSVVLGQLTIEK